MQPTDVIPEGTHRSGRLLAPLSLAVLAGAAAISAGQTGFLAEYWGDEFLLPWHGKLILMGEVPYVDFFMFLAPFAAWGPAALVALTDVGIAPFRLLNVFVLIVATLSLYGLARVRGATRGMAWCVAGWLPLLLFAVWPMSSHQWIAVALGLAAAASLAVGPMSKIAPAIAGALTATCGLVVQTIGVIVLPVVVGMIWARSEQRARDLSLLCAGAALPVLLCAGLLISQGAFGAFMQYAVLWPLDSYVQEGGFNDGSLVLLMQQRPILSELSRSFPGGDQLNNLLVVPLGLIALGFMARQALRRDEQSSSRREAILLLACLCLVWAVFDMGRSDVPHLAYLSPVFLAVLARYANGASVGARLLRAFLIVGLCAGAARWIGVWIRMPPDPVAVANVDQHIRTVVDRALIDPLDGAREGAEPIVYLSRTASLLYVYWSPLPPPVGYVGAPSWGTNTPEQYRALADFIRENDIPWVVVSREDEQIISDPSPIREILQARYTRQNTVPGGVVFALRPPSGGGSSGGHVVPHPADSPGGRRP